MSDLYNDYALLDDRNRVVFIGSKADMDSSEKGLVWVGIPTHVSVKIGMFYDFHQQLFLKKYLPLPEEKKRLMTELISVYRSKMQIVLQDYDIYETITFAFQVMGLNELNVGRQDTVGVVFLGGLAAGRLETIEETLQATRPHLIPFAQVSGYLTGVKQRLERNIKGIQREDQIDEIEEHIARWKAAPLTPQ